MIYESTETFTQYDLESSTCLKWKPYKYFYFTEKL